MLAQHVLPLGVGHLLLGARFDPALQLEDLDFARQRHGDSVELDLEIVLLEQLLLVLRLHVEQAGQQVGDPQRIVHAGHERLDLWRESGGERERAIDELLQMTHAGIDGDRPITRFLERLQQRLHHATFHLQEFGAGAGDAFDKDAHTGRRLGHLADDADRSDLVQIVGPRFVSVACLEQREDHAVARQRAVYGFDRHRTADAERRHAERKHDCAAQRHDGKFGRERRCERFSQHPECSAKRDITWFRVQGSGSRFTVQGSGSVNLGEP